MRELLPNSMHRLRRRPCGPLAGLAAFARRCRSTAGWTKRLRALVAGRKRPLADGPEPASRAIALSGALALAAAAFVSGDPRHLVWPLGYAALAAALVARERRRRAEMAALRHLVADARERGTFNEALEETLSDLLRLSGARAAHVVARDGSSGRSFRYDLNGPASSARSLHTVETTGQPSRDEVRRPGFRIAFKADEWSGILVLTQPALDVDGRRAGRFLARAAGELAPVFVAMRRQAVVKARVARHERAKLERELHDRVIQSLIAAEMNIATFGRRARPVGAAGDWRTELSRTQAVLRQEILQLRDFMRELKANDVSPDQLLRVLQDLIDRFGRDTGIDVELTTAGDVACLPHRAGPGIVRIVQEALTNVRKHSGAANVDVRLAFTPSQSTVIVQDDGRGFGFAGRVTLDAATAPGPNAARRDVPHPARPRSRVQRSIPAVLRDSVVALGGQLTIQSTPGSGARIHVSIPVESTVAAARADRWMAS